MSLEKINRMLAQGDIDAAGLFPHRETLKNSPFQFSVDFGLTQLPKEPGILVIRGARQYGKSTWLEQALYQTIQEFGPGSAFYLNGEYIPDANKLEEAIENLIPAYRKNAPTKRLFIDEITAIPYWEKALKRMADQGKLSAILIITTGSKATDLRRGIEKLPGRKGKLDRSNYLFTPLSYSSFYQKCHKIFKKNAIIAYLISGGSPIACSELARHGFIPEYVIELTRDWIEGEMAASGRNRTSLMNIMNVIFRFGGTPVGQAKLARESGLSNNTVAADYIEILSDLGCVIPAYPWDSDKKIILLRKECKYHFTNLLAALTYSPEKIRSIDDFLKLSEKEQAKWYEWLIAQELTRRAAIHENKILEPLIFWKNKSHEIDFVENTKNYIEIKRGKSSAIEFGWFPKQFKNTHLTVINNVSFETDLITGIKLEDFLLES